MNKITCMMLVLLSLPMSQKGTADCYGIEHLHTNVGSNATFCFAGYTSKVQEQECKVKRYEIWILVGKQFRRIYASEFGNGSTLCVNNCNSNEGRGSILVDSPDVKFVLQNVTAADQNLYCLLIKCSEKNDIVDCKRDAVSLVPVEPVKWVSHTMIGLSHTVKLGETVRGNCVADGNPTPNIKVVNTKTNEIVCESRTNSLNYSFQVLQRQQKVFLRCEASNNPNQASVTKLLKVDVKYPPSIESSCPSKIKLQNNEGQFVELWASSSGSPLPEITVRRADGKLMKKGMGEIRANISQPGVFHFIADNGITPKAVRYIEVISGHSNKDSSHRNGRPSKDCYKEKILYLGVFITLAVLVVILLIVVASLFYLRQKERKKRKKELHSPPPQSTETTGVNLNEVRLEAHKGASGCHYMDPS